MYVILTLLFVMFIPTSEGPATEEVISMAAIGLKVIRNSCPSQDYYCRPIFVNMTETNLTSECRRTFMDHPTLIPEGSNATLFLNYTNEHNHHLNISSLLDCFKNLVDQTYNIIYIDELDKQETVKIARSSMSTIGLNATMQYTTITFNITFPRFIANQTVTYRRECCTAIHHANTSLDQEIFTEQCKKECGEYYNIVFYPYFEPLTVRRMNNVHFMKVDVPQSNSLIQFLEINENIYANVNISSIGDITEFMRHHNYSKLVQEESNQEEPEDPKRKKAYSMLYVHAAASFIVTFVFCWEIFTFYFCWFISRFKRFTRVRYRHHTCPVDYILHYEPWMKLSSKSNSATRISNMTSTSDSKAFSQQGSSLREPNLSLVRSSRTSRAEEH
ncbi:unnamed protein product [Bursaphelenchus okinawaensis]|uniref:Uncharacterized protein n=1 Tax=Bursaphelenchus okinawaensis TaxID=465554 RepID=A0A811L9B8_9BILA|nr:unnamed protein product [Bursaphelenchus okinawaensis]CAG9119050.1 unnamed protein product [Bursaphelenchus okinawaensis]